MAADDVAACDVMVVGSDRIRFNRPEPSNAYCKEGNKCMWCPQPGEGLACWHYWCQVRAAIHPSP